MYVKVDKYKREYHAATKSVKMAETQENNAKLDGALTQEQVKYSVVHWILEKKVLFIQRAKIQEKLERSRKEKDAAKMKYTEALQELNRANPKYMDDMNEVIE